MLEKNEFTEFKNQILATTHLSTAHEHINIALSILKEFGCNVTFYDLLDQIKEVEEDEERMRNNES